MLANTSSWSLPLYPSHECKYHDIFVHSPPLVWLGRLWSPGCPHHRRSKRWNEDSWDIWPWLRGLLQPTKLMDERAFHTQDGPLTCGGESRPDPGNDDHITKYKTCFMWKSGAWTLSHSLVHARTGHVSFTTSQGTFLMGGEGFRNDKTSELLKPDGSVEPGFELKHRTQ